MRRADYFFLLAFAAVLTGAGLVLLGQESLLVKLKSPRGMFLSVEGWRLYAVAASPVLVAAVLVSAAERVRGGDQLRADTVRPFEVALFWCAIGLLLLGLLTAPRVAG